MQKYEAAANELSEITDESTGNLVAFNNLLILQLYMNDSKVDKSLSFFEQMISVNPNRYCNEYATINYSRIYGLLNKPNESKKAVLKEIVRQKCKNEYYKQVFPTIL